MILRAEPVLKAIEMALKKIVQKNAKQKNDVKNLLKNKKTYKDEKPKIKIINFAPSAQKFETSLAKNLAQKYTDIILISGRYEGIDARVTKILKKEIGAKNFAEISIGDYVLTGGELPAMVLIDSISRQISGVLGKYESLEEERISASEFYTRPEILQWKDKKHKVPKVLLSGDHKEIEKWKQEKSGKKSNKSDQK